MQARGLILVSSAAIALGAMRSPVDDPRERPRAEIARLIANLPADDVPRNMDAAVFGLVQNRSPLTTPMLIDAWYSAQDGQLRDAITAVLWYRDDAALAYRREIIGRTLCMIGSAEHEGPVIRGTLYGNDAVAMRFLQGAIVAERDTANDQPIELRAAPIAGQVRSVASLGHGRARFLATCLLSFAHDPADVEQIIHHLLPHLRDNDIMRDAASAELALGEIARTSPLAVERLRLDLDPQAREAARHALDRDLPSDGDEPQSVNRYSHWPRLPRVNDPAFDSLHTARQLPPGINVGEADFEFNLRGVPFRYHDDTASSRDATEPIEVIEAFQGNRWTTVCIGRWVRPAVHGFDGEVNLDVTADDLRRGFSNAILRGPGNTEFIAFRVDSGGASGRGWRHVLIPVRDGVAALGETATFHESTIDDDGPELCISEPDVDCRLRPRADDDDRYDRWEIEIAHQWDGRCWAPTIDPDRPVHAATPDH